jgi:hypothetical protein
MHDLKNEKLKVKIEKAGTARIPSAKGGTKKLSSMIKKIEIAAEKRRYV